MDSAKELCLLYVTIDSRQSASEIAHSLLKENLIACANIMDNATSVYRWGNEIMETAETIMIAKTTKDKAATAIQHISQLHPYECPCIVALPSTNAFSPFANWIYESVEDPS